MDARADRGQKKKKDREKSVPLVLLLPQGIQLDRQGVEHQMGQRVEDGPTAHPAQLEHQ